jgi:hypothetical protein
LGIKSGRYEVLILPEYNGNLNWTETLQWISTDFTGVPVCLSVFEGGKIASNVYH